MMLKTGFAAALAATSFTAMPADAQTPPSENEIVVTAQRSPALSPAPSKAASTASGCSIQSASGASAAASMSGARCTPWAPSNARASARPSGCVGAEEGGAAGTAQNEQGAARARSRRA